MATSTWATVRDDTIERIVGAEDGSPAGITPTFDPSQRWHYRRRPRATGEGGRDREFTARDWDLIGDVQVFGGGEDQLGRDLKLRVTYLDSKDFEDRRHCDERDLVGALESASTLPTGCKVRRVVREDITITMPSEGEGTIEVVFPIRLIWRESASHI